MAPEFSYRALSLAALLSAALALAWLQGAARAQSPAATPQARAAQLVERAGQHHGNSEWKAAVADATEALNLDANSAAAYNVRGDALSQMGGYKRAIADLTEAIRLDPNMRVVYINRGAAYEKTGQNDLALADYNSATALFPDWEVDHRLRYELLLKLNRYAEAIASLTKRSELLPKHIYILAERAEAYRAMGDFDRAFADYDEAIKRSPNDASFREGRALLHQARGDDAKAIAEFTAAIEIAPNAKGLYLNRARLYRAQGNVAAAEADETRARNVPKNWPDPAEFMLLLALGLLLSWPKAIVGIAAAVFIRPLVASMAAAVMLCIAIEFLPDWQILDSASSIIPAVMAGLAGLVWWAIGRVIYRLVRPRRVSEVPPPAPP